MLPLPVRCEPAEPPAIECSHPGDTFWTGEGTIPGHLEVPEEVGNFSRGTGQIVSYPCGWYQGEGELTSGTRKAVFIKWLLISGFRVLPGGVHSQGSRAEDGLLQFPSPGISYRTDPSEWETNI